jgi:hypothetical protein
MVGRRPPGGTFAAARKRRNGQGANGERHFRALGAAAESPVSAKASNLNDLPERVDTTVTGLLCVLDASAEFIEFGLDA